MRKLYLNLMLFLFLLFAVPLHADNVWGATQTISVGKRDVSVSAGTISKFAFSPAASGSYSFFSTGSADTYGYLYDASGTVLKSDDDSGTGSNFKITYTLEKGVQYYFGVKYYNASASGIVSVELTDNFTSLSNTQNSITISRTETFSYVPYVTGDYVFTVTKYKSLKLNMYDENGSEVSVKDNSASSLTYELNAGKRYYLTIENSSSSSVSATVIVTDPAVSTGYVDAYVKVGAISKIKFIADETVSYTIRTYKGKSPVVYLYDENKNRILTANSSQLEENVEICPKLTKGQTYYIGIKRTDSSGYVDETLWIDKKTSRLGMNTAIFSSGSCYRVSFDAHSTGNYKFYSNENGSTQTVKASLYSQDGSELISTNKNTKFSFKYKLVQGERYFIEIELTSGTTKDIPFYIEPGGDALSCGTYTFDLKAGEKIARKINVPCDRKYKFDFGEAKVEKCIYREGGTTTSFGSSVSDFFKTDDYSVLEFGFSNPNESGQITLTISESCISQGKNYLSSAYTKSGSVKLTVSKTADYRLKITPGQSEGAGTAKLLDEKNTVLANCDTPTKETIIFDVSLQAGMSYYLFLEQADSNFGLGYDVEIEERVSSVIEGDNTVVIPAGETVRVLWSAPRSGYFDIYTTGDNDTVGALCSYENAKIAQNDDYNGDRNFRLNRYVNSGEKYYIDIRYYSSSLSGNVNLRIEEKTLELGVNTIDLPSKSARSIKYIIPEGGTYSFYTTGNDYTFAQTIRVNNSYIAGQIYSGGEGHNFRYTNTFNKDAVVELRIFYNDEENHALAGAYCEGSGKVNLVVEKINWSWNVSSGVLNIFGNGSIPDFRSYAAVPWYNQRSYIREVVVSEGITSVGKLYCPNATQVDVPSTVSYISPRAFEGCSSLTTVTISSENMHYTVKNSAVFSKDETMLVCVLPVASGTYEVPEGTVTIGDSSFLDCAVSDIIVPSGVVRIGVEAMNRPDIKTIKIPKSVVSFSSSGLSFCRSATTIIGYSGSAAENYANRHGNPFVSIEVHNWGTDLTWENYPSDTLVITGTGNSVMPSYNSSTYMYVPWYSISSNIKHVEIKGVSKIGSYCFSWLYNLEEIVVPYGVTGISDSAYLGCKGATSVSLPDSLITIGGKAFSDCSSVSSLVIPDSVTYIGAEAFADMNSLEYLKIPFVASPFGCWFRSSDTNVPGWPWTVQYSNWEFQYPTKRYYLIPASIKKVELSSCSLENASEKPFYNCNFEVVYAPHTPEVLEAVSPTCTESGLTEGSICSVCNTVITEQKVIEPLGHTMGEYLGTKTEATCITEGEKLYRCTVCQETYGEVEPIDPSKHSGNTVIANQKEATVDEPGYTGDECCSDCGAVLVPGKTIEKLMGGHCGENLIWLFTDDGTLTVRGTGAMDDYSSMENLPWQEYREQISKIVVEENVTSIGKYAFYNCKELQTLILPEQIEVIDGNAFGECGRLENVIYFGTEEKQEKILVGENNEQLLSLQWLYVSSMDDLCTVEILECEHGNVTLSRNGLCSKGMKITVTVTPERGYVVESVWVNKNEIMPDENGIYSFMIEENSTVSASFVPRSEITITMEKEVIDGKEAYIVSVSDAEQVKEHGILIGTDLTINEDELTLDTPGRIRLAYQGYEKDGKSYIFVPDDFEKCMIKAYVIEEDGTVHLCSDNSSDKN